MAMNSLHKARVEKGLSTMAMNSLHKARVEKGLSTRELARLADVTQVTIVRLENGQTARALTIRKLAKALGLKPGDLSDIWYGVNRNE